MMKTVVSLTKGTVDPNAVPGVDLQQDMICYNIRCPKVTLPSQLVEDQFGQRLFEKFKPKRLCTPARKVTITGP